MRTDESTLLVISHTPSVNTTKLSESLVRGAKEHLTDGMKIKCLSPFDVTAVDVLEAQSVILGTTENFGYMAGATKDFFDRCYYTLLDNTDALPYAVYIRAGLDGTGASNAIDSICGALKWKQVLAPLVLQGEYKQDFELECASLGATMAAGMEAGIF